MADPVQVLRKHQETTPVNIEAMILELGVKLDKKAELDDEISGQIERLGDGSYLISVNKENHYYRQRFTMAHELAHYLYHRDLIEDGVDDDKAYRSVRNGKYHNTNILIEHEQQANQFAASILMPRQLILDELERAGLDLDTFEQAPDQVLGLAKRLQVSRKALEIRLRGLQRDLRRVAA